MNDLQIFESEKFGKVRVIIKDGVEWFCLKDVCDALGIENSRNVKQRLNLPGVHDMDIGINTGLAVQQIKMTFINEPNLYRTIFQSRKPEAEAFQDWITEEVIPTIRKTGQYHIKPPTILEVIKNQIQALEEITQEQEKIKFTQREHTKEIARLENNVRRTVCSNNLTVIAYCNMKGIRPNSYNSSVIGRKATKMCRLENREREIGKVVDSKYGLINTYPSDILDKIFF